MAHSPTPIAKGSAHHPEGQAPRSRTGSGGAQHRRDPSTERAQHGDLAYRTRCYLVDRILCIGEVGVRRAWCIQRVARYVTSTLPITTRVRGGVARRKGGLTWRITQSARPGRTGPGGPRRRGGGYAPKKSLHQAWRCLEAAMNSATWPATVYPYSMQLPSATPVGHGGAGGPAVACEAVGAPLRQDQDSARHRPPASRFSHLTRSCPRGTCRATPQPAARPERPATRGCGLGVEPGGGGTPSRRPCQRHARRSGPFSQGTEPGTPATGFQPRPGPGKRTGPRRRALPTSGARPGASPSAAPARGPGAPVSAAGWTCPSA